MKRFMKKRWHNVPVGIVTVVLLFLFLAGGAFAAYSTWSGTAEVTVDECFVISNVGGDNGDYSGTPPQWAVSLYPGESKTLKVNIHNNSSVALDALLAASESYESINASWTPSTPGVPSGGDIVSTLTVTAVSGAQPGIFTVGLDISR
jgi:hypothetical protein